MNRSEFVALPPSVALGVLYDGNAKIREIVEAAETPAVPRPPKYDTRVPRKDGFMWASEMELQDLQWWHAHKLERAAQGGQWAEKDQKLATKLQYWIDWRTVAPTAAWRGVRNDGEVTAQAPAGKAQVHSWEQRAGVTSPLPLDDDPSWVRGDAAPSTRGELDDEFNRF